MSDNPTITTEELAELLVETGHHHHQAYIESDGVDPEWALWYSGYLQSRLWDRAGVLPSRSQLIQLLMNGNDEHEASGGDSPWPAFYAKGILESLGASS